jgi:exodeoxyribonuclease V alpha subunit
MPATLRDAEGRPLKDLHKIILAQFRPFLEATTVAGAFAALAQFRILCALRRGPHGVETLNRLTEEILALERMHFAAGDPQRPARKLDPAGRFYDHRVVMISRNDYGLRLFNGDVGIVLPETAGGGMGAGGAEEARLTAWFEVSDEATGRRSYRHLPCHMLPEHETAFAMTIHKSQGSQFRDILVLLPPQESPVLTRELLYTGLTRAEKRVWLWCGERAFKLAATRRTVRASGLAATLGVGR